VAAITTEDTVVAGTGWAYRSMAREEIGLRSAPTELQGG